MKYKSWIGGLLSLGLLVFLFTRIDIVRLWAVVRSVNAWYLPAVSLTVVFFFWLRALRWRYFMDPVKKDVGVGRLFSATMIGFMANNILPARLGEFVRAYALGRTEDVPKSSVFATVVVERVFDGLSVLLLMITTIALLPPGLAGGEFARKARELGALFLGLYVVIIVCLGFFVYRPRTLVDGVRAVVRPFSQAFSEKAAYMAESFIMGLGVVKDPRLLGMIVAYSAVHWGLAWLPNYLLFKAFGMSYGIYPSLFLLVFISFGIALPSTPGAVGTFHAAAVAGLVLLGQDKETALGFAILAHAISYLTVTLIGLYYLYREGLSLGGIRNAEPAGQGS